jgi:hypothetical protein
MKLLSGIAGGLMVWAASLGGAAAAEGKAPGASSPAAEVAISLAENPDGTWDVTYKFARPQTAVVLSQAPVTYREWTPLSDGVTMWRIGGMEGFAFRTPGSDARFRIKPFTGDLPAAYTPFLAFSDGGYGVLSGQFRVKPIASLAKAVEFGKSGEDWPEPVMTSQVSIASPRLPGAQEGRTHSEFLPGGDGTIVYVGSLAPVEGDSFRGYIDPGLPAWLIQGFDADLTTIFTLLGKGWGRGLGDKARVFMVFGGYDNKGLSLKGGAIGNLLSLQMSGADLADPTPEIRTYVRWFLAHEAAHIFQREFGNDAVLFADDGGHAWVHEGSANAFAYRVGADLADNREAYLAEVYGGEYKDCVAHLEKAALVEARDGGNFRAYYACGDLIALATDAMLPDHDLFDFWNALQAASVKATGTDRAELYFRVLAELGAPAEGIERLRAFVWKKPAAAADFVQTTMAMAGLPVAVNDKGDLVGIRLRAEADRKSLHLAPGAGKAGAAPDSPAR